MHGFSPYILTQYLLSRPKFREELLLFLVEIFLSFPPPPFLFSEGSGQIMGVTDMITPSSDFGSDGT